MADDIKNEKKIDGIKASNEAIANSRKIVLESIGEDAVEPKSQKNFQLDSLGRKSAQKIQEANKETLSNSLQKNTLKKPDIAKAGFRFMDSIGSLKITEKQNYKNIAPDFKADLDRKISSNEISPAIIEDINTKNIGFDNLLAISNPEKSKKLLEKKESKPKDIVKKIEKITQVKKEKIIQEKTIIKKKNEKKKTINNSVDFDNNNKIAALKKEKKADRQKAIEKRKRALFDFFKKINSELFSFFEGYKKNFTKIFKKTLIIMCGFFFFLIALYLTFIFVVLKTDFDKPFSRALSQYFIVPAYLANNKVVDYYFWQDIKKSAIPDDGASLDSAARRSLAKYLVMNELAERYQIESIPFSDINKDIPRKKLAEKALYDENFNRVAISRIKSIKKMIDEKGDFISVSEKYGDNLGKATITSENSDNFLYYEKIKNLQINEVSDIIYTQDGYYIFRCFEKNENEQILSYVMVNSLDFDKVLNKMIEEYKFISFVD